MADTFIIGWLVSTMHAGPHFMALLTANFSAYGFHSLLIVQAPNFCSSVFRKQLAGTFIIGWYSGELLHSKSVFCNKVHILEVSTMHAWLSLFSPLNTFIVYNNQGSYYLPSTRRQLTCAVNSPSTPPIYI